MPGLLSRFSFRTMARVVALILGLALLALAVSFQFSRQSIIEAEQEWLTYQQQSARKLDVYNRMRVEIGFGGLIHNFKNYLLRKEAYYRDEVYLRAQTLRDLVADYRKLAHGEAEAAALEIIEDVINQLEGSIAVAESLFETDIPLEAIDSQIAFDEVPAMWALDTLADVSLEEQSSGEQRLVNALRKNIERTTWLGIGIICAFAVAILMFLAAIRASVRRLEETTRAVNAIAGGQTGVEVQFTSERNEIGDLARGAVAFQHAMVQVQQTNEELQTMVQHLEATMEKAVQAEKLASLGQLVAGVAHEINTPLGVAVTACSVVAEETGRVLAEVGKDKPSRTTIQGAAQRLQEASRLMTDNLDRSSRLVSSFRRVAADQHNESVRAFDVYRFLEQVLDTLHSTIGNREIHIDLECPEGLRFTTYPGVLSQIITQLTLNSVEHAFEPDQPGRIRICLRLTTEGELELVYSDNGRGVSEEVMDRIYDPFYTTSRGKGRTGLGMHVVFNQVVKVLQGRISCERPETGGLLFRVVAPSMSAFDDRRAS